MNGKRNLHTKSTKTYGDLAKRHGNAWLGMVGDKNSGIQRLPSFYSRLILSCSARSPRIISCQVGASPKIISRMRA